MVDQAFSNHECNATMSSFLRPVLGQDEACPSSSSVSLPAAHPLIRLRWRCSRWGKTDEDRGTAVIEEDIHRVEEYFTKNKKASLREPTVDLELCYVTIWNIFEVECLLPPQSQPADEEEHGRLIGVRPLVPASSRACKKKVWLPRARTLTPSTTSSDFMP